MSDKSGNQTYQIYDRYKGIIKEELTEEEVQAIDAGT